MLLIIHKIINRHFKQMNPLIKIRQRLSICDLVFNFFFIKIIVLETWFNRTCRYAYILRRLVYTIGGCHEAWHDRFHKLGQTQSNCRVGLHSSTSTSSWSLMTYNHVSCSVFLLTVVYCERSVVLRRLIHHWLRSTKRWVKALL